MQMSSSHDRAIAMVMGDTKEEIMQQCWGTEDTEAWSSTDSELDRRLAIWLDWN